MLPFPGEGSNLALTLPLAPAGHQHGRVHSCHGEYQVEECIVVWHRPLVAPANHVHPTRLRITPRRALKQQPCKNPSVKAAVRMASGFGAAGGVPKQDRASERPAARGPSHLPGRKPSEMCCEARVAVRSDLPPTVASRTLRPLSGINGSGHPPFASSLQMVAQRCTVIMCACACACPPIFHSTQYCCLSHLDPYRKSWPSLWLTILTVSWWSKRPKQFLHLCITCRAVPTHLEKLHAGKMPTVKKGRGQTKS